MPALCRPSPSAFSIVAQLVKNLPVMQETRVRSSGWEDPLEKGKATHCIFWPGEFHGLYSPWGHKESAMTEQLSLSHSMKTSLIKVKHDCNPWGQWCPTLCDQARILEWVAFPFSRGSSQPRDWTQVSRIASRFFTNWVIREAPLLMNSWVKILVAGICNSDSVFLRIILL